MIPEMQSKDDLDTPSLLVNLDIMERNIQKMADFTKSCGVNLRPHVKTHKIPELAKIQIEAGARGVCLQKVSEAEVFANHGLDDIFVTNEIVSPQKIQRVALLADRIKLAVAVDSYENAVDLSKACSEVGSELNVLVDIDVGMHRCGVQPGEAGKLAELVSKQKNLVFKGIMGYDGHVGHGKTREDQEKLANESMALIAEAKKSVKKAGISVDVTSVGSSVSTWTDAKNPEVTEVQPGMYVFNAVNLVEEGVATLEDCALTVLCTIMSKPTEDRAIMDAGSKAFHFDQAQYPWLAGLEGATVYAFNEEHAYISLKGESRRLKVKDRVEAIPVHCCTCINQHDEMIGLRGNKVEKIWKIAARGMMK